MAAACPTRCETAYTRAKAHPTGQKNDDDDAAIIVALEPNSMNVSNAVDSFFKKCFHSERSTNSISL